MIKKFLFVTLCSITPLLAYDAHSEKDNLQIGRYQMVSAVPSGGSIIQLYLLDTATGYVWKSTKKKLGGPRLLAIANFCSSTTTLNC